MAVLYPIKPNLTLIRTNKCLCQHLFLRISAVALPATATAAVVVTPPGGDNDAPLLVMK